MMDSKKREEERIYENNKLLADPLTDSLYSKRKSTNKDTANYLEELAFYLEQALPENLKSEILSPITECAESIRKIDDTDNDVRLIILNQLGRNLGLAGKREIPTIPIIDKMMEAYQWELKSIENPDYKRPDKTDNAIQTRVAKELDICQSTVKNKWNEFIEQPLTDNIKTHYPFFEKIKNLVERDKIDYQKKLEIQKKEFQQKTNNGDRIIAMEAELFYEMINKKSSNKSDS